MEESSIQPTNPISTPAAVPNKTKPNWLIPIVFLVLGILIGAGGLYFIIVNAPESPPLEYIQPEATPDPTADWETYNDEFVSFRYPTGWTVSDSNGQSGISSFHYSIDIKNPQQEGPQPATISVSYWDNPKKLDIPTFQKTVKGKPIYSTSYIITDLVGLSGYYTSDGPCEPVLCKSYSLAADDKIFIIELFEPDVTNYKQITDQILSTFKFTDTGNTTQITGSELDRGWYWGLEDQKKPGTPESWVYTEAGKSSCWHKPGTDCAI